MLVPMAVLVPIGTATVCQHWAWRTLTSITGGLLVSLRVARASVALPFRFKGHGPQYGYWRSCPSIWRLAHDWHSCVARRARWKISDQGCVSHHLPSHVMDITCGRKGGNTERVMRSGHRRWTHSITRIHFPPVAIWLQASPFCSSLTPSAAPG